MSNRPRSSQTPSRPPTRRQIAAQTREANLQRRTILAIGAALGLALLLIVSGIIYDRLYQPGRTIKQVNAETLTRGEYEQLARENVIQQMIQSLQFAKLFGAAQSFGQGGTFSDQILSANAQLATFGSSRSQQQAVDDSLVSDWVDRTVVEQAAKSQFQIEPSQGEIDQAIVAQLGSLISQPATVTETATVSETATLTATLEAVTPDAAGAAATAQPTNTPQPTATPGPEQATAQVGQIVAALYDEYNNIMDQLPEEASAQQKRRNLTEDGIAASLRDQYREQVIRTRVQEALVKEVPANDTSDPETVSTRHILLQVPKPSPTPEPSATDVAGTPEATAEATTTAEPTPTPTLAPEELDRLFAERKPEADALYEQLKANPDSFAEVARERSEDTASAQKGGDIDPFNREGQTTSGSSFVPEYVAAAWALKDNEISQPVRSQFGWHIIQRLPEDPQTKLERLRNAAFEKWLNDQRQQATIIPAPTPTPTEVPPVTTETPAPEGTTTP